MVTTSFVASAAAVTGCWVVHAAAASSGVFDVPLELRNVYPAANFNRNVSTRYWQTTVLDGHSNEDSLALSQNLTDASFIVLDQGMYELIGIDGKNGCAPSVEPIFDFPPGPSYTNRLTHDGIAYSPECNCIFLGELYPPNEGFSMIPIPWIWRINLNSNPPKTEQVNPSPPLTLANGATYHKGSIYFIQEGNTTVPGGIVKMDPLTLKTEVVLNNWFGHRFNSPNDIVIDNDDVAYFTDGYYGYDTFKTTLNPELANGVWRFEMKTGNLRQFTGAGGGPFTNPNGVALNAKQDKLYITNRGLTSNDPAGGRTIYEFNVNNKEGIPVTGPTVFSYQDSGFPDGIKTDSAGRVYASANGGVNVWDKTGRQLGIIKVQTGDDSVQMQFVGNDLYIAGREHLYRVHLNATGSQVY
ncbi:hypothetical protein JX265_013062 [Neoarthrinium moseri]|uniref:SMP-30/Gluconolactonase/LRE-like region domain-containing protein n=1 Tax=Neoarthrinium moseri TaxID=1658444 RepID=A0A9P9W939_9PEZI|nr:hypothetical protein JX265_013062 [Neoarthrinium moseri]